MFSYQHHIRDFNNATRHLTRLERSVYRDLMDLYYETEDALTADTEKLCRLILACSNTESTAVEQVLNEFFIKTAHGWFHGRCDEEINAFRKNTSDKAVAGRASAEKRARERAEKLEKLNRNPSPVEHLLNSVSTEHQQNPTNREPLTENHKPVKSKTTPDGELFHNVDVQVISDFKALRARIRSPITKTAIDGIKREADKAGFSLEDALKICCERGWRGFKAEWVQSRITPMKPEKFDPLAYVNGRMKNE